MKSTVLKRVPYTVAAAVSWRLEQEPPIELTERQGFPKAHLTLAIAESID